MKTVPFYTNLLNVILVAINPWHKILLHLAQLVSGVEELQTDVTSHTRNKNFAMTTNVLSYWRVKAKDFVAEFKFIALLNFAV